MIPALFMQFPYEDISFEELLKSHQVSLHDLIERERAGIVMFG
jgi:hypothetical protein